MRPKHKGKISHVLFAINIILMLFFGIAIMMICTRWFTRIMYAEVEQEMESIACSMNLMLETVYPGDYTLVGETAYQLYKGDTDITREYALLDQLKEKTNTEITLFYQDTRILTTLRDKNGARFVGTSAPSIVLSEVLETGTAHFYDSALINGSAYFSYYMPVRNQDGSVVGMLFVGKPSKEVNDSIQGSVYPLLAATAVAMVVMTALLFLYTRSFVEVLLHIRAFLADVATGNLNAVLSSSVSKRNDEFGDIGRSAVAMQSSLRNMIEQDALTELFNRRSGNRKLAQIVSRYESQQTPFCLAIGDIDFFKKVNDTYGHDAGDLILKNVAGTLRKHMRKYGFVARWGGEEFLLVFERMDLDASLAALEETLNDIRTMESEYDGEIIKVTMTFGLTSGDNCDIKQLLKIADDRLYVGKTLGRNQIIFD